MARAVDPVNDAGLMVQLFVDTILTCAVNVSEKSQNNWVSGNISEEDWKDNCLHLTRCQTA